MGSQGPQGVQGATGPQGPQGFQGVMGPQGPQGVQGTTGPQGLQGIQGATGPQGLQGIQGATGPQGLQGVQGATGPQGLQGVQGATGPQGLQGFQGATGSQGLQGVQGATGPQGLQGFQGATGPQGLQGIQGATGPQGIQGEQGATGAAAPNYDLPIIQRIAVYATFNGQFYPLLLELDRPAPQNCFLQFYRYSKKKRNRGRARNFSVPIRYAFRGIFISASNPFPIIPIPEGDTVVTLTDTQWLELYRPVIIRSNDIRGWDQAPPGRPRWNPINMDRDSKATYKFGTCQYVPGESFRASLMSSDTLTIIKYYATNHGVVNQEGRFFIN